MKRALAAILLALATPASALTLAGSVVGDVQPTTRVGAWVVNTAGTPLTEVASAALSGARFSLRVPDQAPTGRALRVLTPETVTWPGVTGDVSFAPSTQGGEIKLFTYVDANGNARHDEGEAVSEAPLQLGKASVVIVYSERETTVTASRGLQLKLQAGWNAVAIEPGKTLKASVLREVTNARLRATQISD